MKPKKINVGRLGLLLGVVAMAATVHGGNLGDGNNPGFYFNTDAGVNIMDDAQVPFLFGGAKVVGLASLDAGMRWDLSMGYAFKLSDQLSLAPELETGILYNSVDQYKLGGVTFPASGNYVQVPLLANLVVDWNFCPQWVAYAGAGLGMDVSASSLNNVGNVRFVGVDTEADLAWQLMAGVRDKINGTMAVGLGYKYMAFTQGNGINNTVGNNAILASFTMSL